MSTLIRRKVYRDSEGDVWVALPGGYMELSEYVEYGGYLFNGLPPLTYIGTFTDAELSEGIEV